jgi:hypothetical protein
LRQVRTEYWTFRTSQWQIVSWMYLLVINDVVFSRFGCRDTKIWHVSDFYADQSANVPRYESVTENAVTRSCGD